MISGAIIIRKARTEDLAAITNIYAHAVENGVASFEIEVPSET